MTDDYTPQLQNHLNYQGEEKPYYDNGDSSAPILQNIQPNNCPNPNNYTNIQTVNPGDNSNDYGQSNYMNNNANDNNNNNYNQNQTENPKKQMCMQLFLGIVLLISTIIDSIMQIIFGYTNLLAMGDDIALLFISLVLLFFSCKKKIARNKFFGVLTILVLFVGFGCKGYAMMYIFQCKLSGALVLIPLIYIILVSVRSFSLFEIFSLFLNIKTKK